MKNDRLEQLAKEEEELRERIAKIQEERAKEREKDLTRIVATFKAELTAHGLTPADVLELLGLPLNQDRAVRGKLSGPGSKKPTAKVTHRNDRGEGTWGGKGRQPKWLADALTNGRKLDEFAVSA